MSDAEFREIYESHKDLLYRFARRMTGSGTAAEDLVHECFLLVWREAAVFDSSRGTMRGFLLGVTRNLALKRMIRERKFDVLEDGVLICMPIDSANRERDETVSRAVAALPHFQREALILAEYEGMTLDEIAQAVGVEVAAVKSRLHRARENLRRILAPLMETKGTAYGT